MSQRGSLSLLMAFGIIPTILFLVIGSLSVSRLYYRLEHQQKINDAAVFFASGAYPDVNLATERVQRYLQLRSNLRVNQIDINFTPEGTNLASSGAYKMELLDVFGIDLEIPYSLFSSAKRTSRNIALAIDTSAYLAPAAFGTVLWESNKYPAANFISSNFNSLQLNRYAANPELLTQSCFNPLFEALKRSALEIAAFEKKHPNNSFAIAAFPGYQNYFDELYYQGESNNSLATTLSQQFKGSALCAAAAEREYSNTAYRFPVANSVFGLDYYIDSQDLSFNSEMISRLTPEELIWSLEAKGESYVYNIDHLIRFIISALSGGINQYSLNKAIILSGDLPRYNTERYPSPAVKNATIESLKLMEQLAILSQGRIELNYVFFKGSSKKNFNDEEVQQFQADIEDTFSTSTALKVQLRTINTDIDYSNDIYEILFKDEKQLLVS